MQAVPICSGWEEVWVKDRGSERPIEAFVHHFHAKSRLDDIGVLETRQPISR